MTLIELTKQFLTSRGRWIVVAALLAIACRIMLGNLNWIDAVVVVCIVACWHGFEWFFHRFLMHEWTFLPLHFTHTRHHDNPTPDNGLPDSWIILMYFAITVVLWLFGLSYLSTLNAAVLVMLAWYEFVHFSCHCNYKPWTWWGWAVRINHLQHHTLDENTRYSMLFPIMKE